MVARFHLDPRVQATGAAAAGARAARRAGRRSRGRPSRRARWPRRPPLSTRRFRSPHSQFPHAHFLSNGAYTVVITNAGGGGSTCRGKVIARLRPDATTRCGRALRLPARRASGSRLVGRPTSRRAASPTTTSSTSRPSGRCSAASDDEIETRLEVAVSPEDDVEVRRHLAREPQRPHARDRGHELRRDRAGQRRGRRGASGVRQALPRDRTYQAEHAALLCRRRPRAADEPSSTRCTC